MQQLRDLAYDGRTVVVVTHSMANLDTCDRLLVLAPGGKMAFYGPPGEALRYFGLPGWAEVFQAFDHYPGRDWAAEFAESPRLRRVGGIAAPEASHPAQRAAAAVRATAAAAWQVAADEHADPAVCAGNRGRSRLPAVHGAPPATRCGGIHRILAARRGLYYRAGGGLLATHLDPPAPPRPPSPALTSVAGSPPGQLTRAATGSACRAGRGGCIPRPAAATSACWHCAGLTRVSSTKWPS